MFNPKKAVQFLARALVTLLPLLTALLVLSILTELHARQASWEDLRGSWRFWLAIGRDTAPGIVALLATYLLAARFVQRLYDVKHPGEARAFVHHCLFGLWSFGPWVRIAGGTAEAGAEHILMRVGGPGHLVVCNDSAVLVGRAGHFTDIFGSGFVPLAPYQKAYQVLDLRPIRKVQLVRAMSKEGIPIDCEVDISFQIDGTRELPPQGKPYPVVVDNAFRAATCTWVRGTDRFGETGALDWASRIAFHEADNTLRAILARYPLDRLIGFAGPDSAGSREPIRQELEAKLRAVVPAVGARLLGVELGDIKVQHQVTRQWIDAWKSEWERWTVERQAQGRARQTEQLENAKTRAQVMMLTSITEVLQPLVQEQQAVTARLVLSRLFMVLSRAPSDPLTRVNLPREALHTLELVRKLLA